MSEEYLYRRELPGNYYISITPGTYVSEKAMSCHDVGQDQRNVLAAYDVLAVPGLQLELAQAELNDLRLELPGGENERRRLEEDLVQRGKLLPQKQYLLTLTGRLMGWKLIRIEFQPQWRICLTFCDIWTHHCITYYLVCYDGRAVPRFEVEAMGEGGMTRYIYLGVVDGKVHIHEIGEYYQRILYIGRDSVVEVYEPDN